MAGTEGWVDPRKINKVKEAVDWKSLLALPAIRPQQHIAEKLVRTNKNINTCSNCAFAYRKTKTGEVMCGNLQSGHSGDTILRPFDFGCRGWKLRRKEQPPVFKDPAKNKQLARYADYVQRGDLGIDPNKKDTVIGFRKPPR